MGIEDKLLRGKTILSPDPDTGKDQYNLVHILAGSFLVIVLPLLIFFLSGNNVKILYLSQFLSGAVVGALIGYWAGCVPAITIMVIIFTSTGRMLFKLLGGQLGRFGSTEFTVRSLAWVLFVSVIFGFAYLGARIKSKRVGKA